MSYKSDDAGGGRYITLASREPTVTVDRASNVRLEAQRRLGVGLDQ